MHTRVLVEGAPPIEGGSCRVIAEAGANHNNSVDRAIAMAQKAAAAGAWAIKYQFYKAERLTIRNSPKYWTDDFGTGSQYEAFKLSDKLDYEDYRPVADACRDLGIIFFATPFDLEAVAALERLEVPIYKIASGDITHRPLLEAVADTGKPVLLSTGAATTEEISSAIEWLGLGPDRLVLLACTLTYPTPASDANFARLETFRQNFFPYLTGFSDHTLGPAGGWLTAALGGVCIEKHYTIDKALPDVPDHAMSVDPEELAALVSACDTASLLRGEAWIGPRHSELPARENARRSIVTRYDLEMGHTITEADLDFRRPGVGLSPARLSDVVGRRLTRDLPAETPLMASDLT